MDDRRPTLDYVSPTSKPPPAPLSPRLYLAAITLIPLAFVVITVGGAIFDSGSLFFGWLCGSMVASIPVLFAIGLGLQLNGR